MTDQTTPPQTATTPANPSDLAQPMARIQQITVAFALSGYVAEMTGLSYDAKRQLRQKYLHMSEQELTEEINKVSESLELKEEPVEETPVSQETVDAAPTVEGDVPADAQAKQPSEEATAAVADSQQTKE